MTRKIIFCVALFAFFLFSYSQKIATSKVFADVEKQADIMLTEISKAATQELVSPRTLDSNGRLKLVPSRDWTSGFFPGELWFLYEYTGNLKWKTAAEKYTANIEREKTNAGTHDMGFKVYSSFGTGYRLINDPHYKEVIVEAARTLSKRFNTTTGVIKSWDNQKKWKYPVIIDNMMNLELLFAATALTGDSSFYKIAVTHANITMKNHFRADNSSWHVVDYDTATGSVLQKTTHQGFSDESAWSRGQAWGLYGFTMAYRFTGDRGYLQHAEKIAAYILNHPNMPKDLVPYWDFNAPGIPNEKRDASAAAVIASALYELSTYSVNGKLYRQKADKIIKSLTDHYRSAPGENKGFIILHCVGSKPSGSEVDVPLSYGDYYYLEALLRSKNLHEKKKNILVSSIIELQKAIDAAKPGDVIMLKKGVYTTTEDIVINKQGTKTQPITISAQEPGATEITGAGGFNIVSPASWIIVRDFKFTHGASHAATRGGSSFCRWTNNIFETPGTGEYLTIAGSDHEIDHNTFQNKDSLGRFIAIRGTGKQIAERLWIHHNYFKTQKNQGNRNGAEAFQFGLSGFSLSSSNSVVEYNLFEDCAGENELISVKASRVTLRYNTIRNCPAQFTLRHGNFNEVYGNFFTNTPGLRIFGDDHLIYSNRFENCSIAITIGNGDGEVADGAQLTAHDRPDRVVIVNNILVNNKANFVQQGRKDGLGSSYITVVYNVVHGGGPAASIVGPAVNYTWKGNVVSFPDGPGDIPEGGFVIEDPKNINEMKMFDNKYAFAKAISIHILQPSDVGFMPK